jgi:two-component system, OmpR family, sensor histidine kinase SenX3
VIAVVVGCMGLVAVALFARERIRRRSAEVELVRVKRQLDDGESRVGEEQRRVELLARVLDGMPFGVMLFGHDGSPQFVNGTVAVIGQTLAGRALLDDTARSLASEGESDVGSERRLDLVGPPRRVVMLRSVPLRGRVLVLIEDVTELDRLESARSDFVANISHELRTPVGALALLAETMIDENDPVLATRLAERVVVEAQRVTRTIEELLELSRIEAISSPVMERMVMSDVVTEVVARLQEFADQQRVTIEATAGDDVLVVDGVRGQLISAVTNLVENAVKYSEPASTVEIRVEGRRLDGGTLLCDLVVTDHGVGIPAHDLQRIFERFYRVDRARSRATGGTGLGLSIVRHVADNHRGTVMVRSVEGEGSTFTLTLPAVDGRTVPRSRANGKAA